MNEELLAKLTELVHQGKILEAGWIAFRETMLEDVTNKDQLFDMRVAYYSGAHQVFKTLMETCNPNITEPEPKDLKVIAAIDREVKEFLESIKREGPSTH